MRSAVFEGDARDILDASPQSVGGPAHRCNMTEGLQKTNSGGEVDCPDGQVYRSTAETSLRALNQERVFFSTLPL